MAKWHMSAGIFIAFGEKVHALLWLGLTVLLTMAGALWVLWRRLDASSAAYQRERRGREEMEAYTRLDTRMVRDGDLRGLAERVCNVLAARSPFDRVAMLVRDADGTLYIAASLGMDPATVAAVEEWASRTTERERRNDDGMVGDVRFGAKSQVISLAESCGRAIVDGGRSDGWGSGGVRRQRDERPAPGRG